MYNPKIFLLALSNSRQKVLSSLRNIHTFQVRKRFFAEEKVLNQQARAAGKNETVNRSLFFTNLPKKKREKKVKVKIGHIPCGSLIIQCKNENLNHYSGMHYSKFDVVPLASKGWFHRKSKGDYFTILPSKPHPAFIAPKEDLPDTFEENGVSKEVIQQLKKINVLYPTVIQAKSIMAMLSGRNVFISSECGSGKTLAYLIATIENVKHLKEKVTTKCNAPLAIILLPTKELALQIGELAQRLCSDLGIICQTLTGGDIKQLLQNPHVDVVDILICTPLVIKKHLEAKLYSAELCRHVIFDEADTLVEEDFSKQVAQFVFVSKLSFVGLYDEDRAHKNCCQVCFVSATAPSDMEGRLQKIIKESDFLSISTPHVHKVVNHIPQLFMRVSKTKRPEELLKIVKRNNEEKIPTMIFCNKKKTSIWVSLFLGENGIKCPMFNQSADSSVRFQHFRDFQQGVINFISCTDLGSRGLHFERVRHVINFEFPSFLADYIHRCGRVGRLGQGDCQITNFISSGFEIPVLNKIETAVRTATTLRNVYSDRVIKPHSRRMKIRRK